MLELGKAQTSIVVQICLLKNVRNQLVHVEIAKLMIKPDESLNHLLQIVFTQHVVAVKVEDSKAERGRRDSSFYMSPSTKVDNLRVLRFDCLRSLIAKNAHHVQEILERAVACTVTRAREHLTNAISEWIARQLSYSVDHFVH